MKAIQIISQDLFDKIRSRFSNLEMGNETGSVTIDPAEARFFDFDFVVEDKNLGRISVSINDAGSLKLYYSQNIVEDKESEIKKYWYNFLKEMRYFAMRRLLRFDTRDISKNNLDKNDFQYLASKTSKEQQEMKMNESRWTGRNTSKTSRRVQGRTQVIVRHKDRVNEMLPADRSKSSNIVAIFIQNADGERFKAPFNYLPLAFALAQHIDHGGVPYDNPAKKIIGMCEQIAQLSEFKKHVKTSKLHSDTLGIVDKAVSRLNELKSILEALGKKRHYESWIAEFNENDQQDNELIELSPVELEEYKTKFTQNEFNENLIKFFPLLHSITQEKIDLEKYVNEEPTPTCTCDSEGTDSACPVHGLQDDVEISNVKNEAFNEFEQWAESVEQGKLDKLQLKANLKGESLEKKLSEIPLGPGGAVAWGELSTLFGLNETTTEGEALKNQLEEKSKTADVEAVGLDGPVMDIFKSWIDDVVPEWKSDLPELFPTNTPALDQTNNIPVTPEEEPIQPQPVAEDSNGSTMIQEIAKLVKSGFNRDNPNGGPWPRGEEGMLIDVEKTISEKFGEQAGFKARQIAEKFIEKLTQQWQEKHGNTLMGEKSEIDRLRELLGNVKQKVENIDDSTKQRDTNIKWRDAARTALKDKIPYSPTGLPGYVDRMKKLSGIINKK